MRAFEARQRLTEAVVRAEAEREVVVELTADVEPIGIVEVPLVAVPGRRQRHHDAPGRHHLPVVLDVLHDVPAVLQRVGLEAQDLLDGVGHERRIVDEQAAAGRGYSLSSLPM